MNSFLDAVGHTALSQAMQDNADAIIPLIQGVHIVCLAIVFTSAALIDLRLLGVVGRNQPLPGLTARYLPWIGWCLLVLLATGLLLMIAEPTRALLNHFFQLKMVALAIVCVMTWALGKSVARHPDAWAEPEKNPKAKLIAIVSLILWIVIVIAGRWIAYGG